MRTMAKSFNLEMMSRPKEKCTAVRMRPEEGFCVQSGYCAAIFGIKIVIPEKVLTLFGSLVGG